MRILYLQFTNAAGYPPLRRGIELLLEQGWEVHVLGVPSLGTADLVLPSHARLSTEVVPPMGRTAVHYAAWMAAAVRRVGSWQPDWIYASDPLACPAALLLRRAVGGRVIYHEHDAPGGPASGLLRRGVRVARTRLARRAALCVLPSAAREAAFLAETGAGARSISVWNCPLRREVGPPREARAGGQLRLWYHGSLVPERLPLSILDALARLPAAVTFTFAGFETLGGRGHTARFLGRAAELGLERRVTALGTLPDTERLVEAMRRADVGCLFLDERPLDPNLATLQGASNKVFEYMAQGLAVLAAAGPGWEELVTASGAGVTVPAGVEALVAAVHGLLDAPATVAAMGEAGRGRILDAWNYDTTFQPVVRRLEDG